MKSIIQENSTIVKAINQAWDEAGKPQEFSVKILQEPETNFFGMTTKSAKVAIFFNDATHKERTPARKQRSYQQHDERPAFGNKHKQEPFVKADTSAKHDIGPKHTQHSDSYRNDQRQHANNNSQHNAPARKQAVADDGQEQTFWTQEMIDVVDVWMKTALDAMQMAGMHFTTQSDRYLLTIKFGKPLHDDSNKEKDIYRSLSLLAIQSLKHKLKRPLRGFKILLTRA